MDKLKTYIVAFLTFCVFSSKNIIIYNEETLVAISFLAFVIFVSRYFGNTIKDSLDERKESIQIELQNLGVSRQESLENLLGEYQKLSSLDKGLSQVHQFTTKELLSATFHGEKALENLFSHQIQQKLKTLEFSKIALQQKLQQFMASNLLENVYLQFQYSKKENTYKPFDRQLIHNAIHILSGNK